MLRILVTALALLHLGPGIAFALLAFGCDEGHAWLGAICAGSQLRNFALLTLGAWAVMVPVAVVWVRRANGREGG